MNFFILLCTVLCSKVVGRAGAGGTRVGVTKASGGGRGGGGARFGVGRGGGASGVQASSSFSGGIRTGSGGWKIGTSSSPNLFGSSSFRSTVFASTYSQVHTPIFISSLTNALIISSIARPIIYDNRQYFWDSKYAQEKLSPSEYPVLCEYQIGADDGQLQNVTFSNGTSAKSLFFGCAGSMVACCGMYCCHNIGEYVVLGLLFSLITIFVIFTLCSSMLGERRKSRRYAARSLKCVRTNIPMVRVTKAVTAPQEES